MQIFMGMILAMTMVCSAARAQMQDDTLAEPTEEVATAPEPEDQTTTPDASPADTPKTTPRPTEQSKPKPVSYATLVKWAKYCNDETQSLAAKQQRTEQATKALKGRPITVKGTLLSTYKNKSRKQKSWTAEIKYESKKQFNAAETPRALRMSTLLHADGTHTVYEKPSAVRMIPSEVLQLRFNTADPTWQERPFGKSATATVLIDSVNFSVDRNTPDQLQGQIRMTVYATEPAKPAK